MDFFSLFVTSVGLSCDAFAASVFISAFNKKLKFKKILCLSLAFGFFQALMPTIGWVIGQAGATIIAKFDHWIAFTLLSYLGAKMYVDAFNGGARINNSAKDISIISEVKDVLLLAIATSIDALTAGIILPSIIATENTYFTLISTGFIGIVTFLFSFSGAYLGKKLGAKLSIKAQILGGSVLLIMAIKILLQHLINHI